MFDFLFFDVIVHQRSIDLIRHIFGLPQEFGANFRRSNLCPANYSSAGAIHVKSCPSPPHHQTLVLTLAPCLMLAAHHQLFV
jgi:hypothetical protein